MAMAMAMAMGASENLILREWETFGRSDLISSHLLKRMGIGFQFHE